MLAIWSLVPQPFLKPAWTSGSSRFMYCWSLAWRILSVTLLVWEISAIVRSSWCHCEVAQSCLTLCDPMDCSLPGSSLLGILQARVLEWVAISFSRESSQPRDQTRISCIPGRRFNLWATNCAVVWAFFGITSLWDWNENWPFPAL